MSKIRLRRKFIFLLFTALSACGQPGPLYLPGTTPPFYVPPEEKTASEKAAAPESKTTTEAKPSTTKPEPELKTPDQAQDPLDQPPTQP
jgi:predicted small lipoprotein YifL